MWMISTLFLWYHLSTAVPIPAAETRPFIVVLDPGHGGTEQGACRPHSNICEKDLTLAVAKQAAKILSSTPGIQVLLTRSTDKHVPLYDRVAFAQKVHADLLVSIHANASPLRNQTGYEVYVYPDEPRVGESGPGSTSAASRSTLSGWSKETILTDLRRLALGRCSRGFAKQLQRAMRRSLGKRGDRGVLTGEMAVLAGAQVPSVLFEMGFLDHPTEGKRLFQPRYRARIVRALVGAIERWRRQARRFGCLQRNLVGHGPAPKNSSTNSGMKGSWPPDALPKILRRRWHGPRPSDPDLVVMAGPRWRRHQ